MPDAAAVALRARIREVPNDLPRHPNNGAVEQAMPVIDEACPKQIRDVMLDCVADGVFTVDERCRITCFNRAAEVITGVPRAEAIGQHCFDVLHGSRYEEECAFEVSIFRGEHHLRVGNMVAR